MTDQTLLRKYLAHAMFADRGITRFDDPGMDGDTPMHLAALNGQVEDIRVMLKCVSDVDVRGDIGNTPLHMAIMGGHAGVVELLLEHGADPTATNDLGQVPLSFCECNAERITQAVEAAILRKSRK